MGAVEDRQAQGKHPGDAEGFFVVGIGASAGGIGALRQFFLAMPEGNGMAFVVVLHLSEEHESHLAQILQANTPMPVLQVKETIKVQPNHVYVIPPAKHLAMRDGHIHLQKPERIQGKRVPIDLFFRTLAEAYGTHAIAVILSGTGSDGTLGIKRVKENGGMVLAQSPEDAEYDAMPNSAIGTNLVDIILPVAELPAKIVAIERAAGRLEQSPRTPKTEETSAAIPNAEAAPESEPTSAQALQEILTLLNERTGHDFSTYKHPTLLRRIARRLQVHELITMSSYLPFLREKPGEVQALLGDLLISVTNFFRDREAFSALEQEVIPRLFMNKTSNDTVRVWSCGCATGEEAYSLAMLLGEYAAKLSNPPKLQVFASDISDEAIRTGREGSYDETMVADVSPERLQHFFVQEENFYRVKKELRDGVLFAPHNVLRDPPFSKLDLIVCRNLLIYLNHDTQHKVLGLFHFALGQSGYLFLGTSESAEGSSALFTVLDKKHRLYQNRTTPPSYAAPLAMPSPGKWEANLAKSPMRAKEGTQSYGDIHYRLVEQFAPPSVLVSEDYELVHVSEHAGRFLHVGGGEPTRNLLKVVHPALKLELQSALLEASKDSRVSESRNVRFAVEGRETLVNITVRLIQAHGVTSGLFLVIFDESKSAALPAPPWSAQTVAEHGAVDKVVQGLEDELRGTRERLRFTLEQSETSTEELKATNEELQAINEELRSALEELETGKEELQSVNEELSTVNQELKEKIDELGSVNADLQNLIGSTDIGTIFLDRTLSIKRYTPLVKDLFNIIPSDVGRPLSHLTHHLDYDHFSEDAAEVLQTLHMHEREVRNTHDGSRYLVRLAPYRTLDQRVDGVVLSFLNVSDLKLAGEALRHSEARLQLALDAAEMGTFVWHLQENRMESDSRMLTLFGLPENSPISLADALATLVHPDDRARYAEAVACATDPAGDGSLRTDIRVVHAGGSERWLAITGQVAFEAKPGQTEPRRAVQMSGLAADITERRRVEENLRQSEARYRTLAQAGQTALWRTDPEGHLIFADALFMERTGLSLESAQDRGWLEAIHPADRQRALEVWRKALGQGHQYDVEIRVRGVEGKYRWVHSRAIALTDQGGQVLEWVGADTDISLRKQTEEALQLSEERFRLAADSAKVLIYEVDLQAQQMAAVYGLERLVGAVQGVNTFGSDWWHSRIHPEDLPSHVGELEKQLAEGGSFIAEYRVWHEQGRWIDVQDTRLALMDENGHTVRLVGSIRDISERKQAEAERARLLELSLHSEKEALVLARIANALSLGDPMTSNLSHLAEQITGVTGALACTIKLYSDDLSKVIAIGSHNQPRKLAEGLAALRQAGVHSPSYWALTRREMKVVNNFRDQALADPHYRVLRPLLHKARWNTAVALPLLQGSGVLGVVLAYYAQDDEPSVSELLLLSTLSSQVALVMQNARLFEQSKQKAALEERQKLARELHDSVSQALYGIALGINSGLGVLHDPDKVRETLVYAGRMTETAMAEMKNLIFELRPESLEQEGLVAALEKLITAMKMRYPQQFRVELGPEPAISLDIKVVLLRIAQEALNNALKHAQAQNIHLSLQSLVKQVRLEISDDGKGFDPAQNFPGHLGLKSMRERAEGVGAKFQLRSRTGGGTKVRVDVPARNTLK